MPDMTPAPRRRPLWRLFILPALLVVAAAAWSGFWFYAASEVGVRADAWRAQEAKAGGSTIAASARSPASRSVSKSAATTPACRWFRRRRARRRRSLRGSGKFWSLRRPTSRNC